MEWLNFFNKGKELSSLHLEQTDVTYQVWELGRVLARIWEIYLLLGKSINKNGRINCDSHLTNRTENLFFSLQSLNKRLSADQIKILGTVEDLSTKIDNLSKKMQGLVNNKSEWEAIQPEFEKVRSQMLCEIRSKSVHLSNIFVFSFGLRYLKTKLMYEINSPDIEKIISDNLNILDNLAMGDKILVSPNLELSIQNLKIIRIRLEGIKKHLSDLRALAQKDEHGLRAKLGNKCDIWTNLLLDLKNPSDCLPTGRKVLNRLAIIFVYYYLIAIPLIIIIYAELHKRYLGIDKNSIEGVLVTGLIPGIISLYFFVIERFKKWLIEKSFTFKICHFT